MVLLSARAGEEARVEGLDAGADDYLIKPFSARELLARVSTNIATARARSAEQQAMARLNAELEKRVEERTAELAAANRQLLKQIEERERVEATLRQMQRLEAVGQLTSGRGARFQQSADRRARQYRLPGEGTRTAPTRRRRSACRSCATPPSAAPS